MYLVWLFIFLLLILDWTWLNTCEHNSEHVFHGPWQPKIVFVVVTVLAPERKIFFISCIGLVSLLPVPRIRVLSVNICVFRSIRRCRWAEIFDQITYYHAVINGKGDVQFSDFWVCFEASKLLSLETICLLLRLIWVESAIRVNFSSRECVIFSTYVRNKSNFPSLSLSCHQLYFSFSLLSIVLFLFRSILSTSSIFRRACTLTNAHNCVRHSPAQTDRTST